MAKKKQIRNVLCFLFMIAILVSALPIFVTQTSAVMPVDNYMGKVTGKNNDVLTVQIEYRADYSEPPNWVSYSTTAGIQWTVSNSDVINEIGIGDYIEIAGYLEIGSYGDSVCIGKMKSRTEKVITDVYGDPDYLSPVHAFTKLTGNLNPPLLCDYIIEYENTPDCSKYQDIQTSGCNVYAKYSDVTIHEGNRQLNRQRLYPGQNYVYDDGKCNVDITFNSGEASADPDCTDQPCFGPQSFSDFTIHIKKIGETKPTHPSPKIVEVKVPLTCVKKDEYATISVTVENNGGHSSEGYISVSFPYDEYIPRSMVSGTGSEHNKLYQKESEIWGKNGKIDRSEDPLVELQEKNWNAGESHTLTMNVKPNSGSDEIVFYVRAALKNDADESYERYPNSGYTDQQGWYVKKYSVDVCSKPDLIDVDIINRFDDKTPQYIHDVFTWVKCVVDKMLRDAFLSFANAPNEPGVYIDNTINLKFENYQEIHKVSGIFGTDYFRWDKITFNTAGNGVYTRNIQIESPVKWRYDAVNTIFKSLSGTGKLPNVPEIGPDTLPEVRLQSVVVELNDGSTVTFEINECLKMFSKSNTFPTLVNRDLDNMVANCPIHLLVIDKQGRKVGIEKSSMSYLEFQEIPNAIYSGDTEPEYIILCDIPEYSVVIQAVEEGKFNFKIDRSTTKTTMTYLDVPVTETTIATVAVSTANPTYTMEIDNNGDGTIDYTNEPDSIETFYEAEEVIFAEDFDTYATGSFPSSGGWNLKYNGRGDSYQIVDNSQSESPPNSFKLEGEANWAANADHPLAETPDQVIYEVDVKVTQPGSSVMNYPDAAIGLANPNIGTWGTRYAGVIFGNAENRVIQPGNIPFNFDQWYHIKVEADMDNGIYDVWLDDQLIASDISTSSNGDYTDIRLEGGNNAHTRVWFDNVNVYRGHYPSQYPNGGLNGVPDGNTITNTIGMEFVPIPAGEFDMGSPSDEGPLHHVNIEKPFYMGRYDVTQKQWRAIMGDNPSDFKGDDLPVETVSWYEVREFIKKLNEKEGIDTYRLPSEAEWEYACRAGTTTRYSFGDSESELGDYAWYTVNSGDNTHPVGQKKPNPWGLYDMHGNVWEWVQDSWHSNYNDAPTDGSAWESGDGTFRVIRGGGWRSFARNCRSALRFHGVPRFRFSDLGFRLLREQ